MMTAEFMLSKRPVLRFTAALFFFLSVTICHFDVLSLHFFVCVSIEFGMGGLGFHSQAFQIGHSVVYGSPPLKGFPSVIRSCVSQALSRGIKPAILLHDLM